MAVLCAHTNIPIAFHDKLSPMIRSQFSDSKVAVQYHSASTKSMCILNGTVAPALLADLVLITIAGSNNTGLKKMSPLTVRVFERSSVTTYFLDMCLAASSTAEGIFTSVNGRLTKLLEMQNPWMNCTAVGVDNTSVNIGVHDSIKYGVQARNSSVYFSGCSCHVLHNAAQKGAEEFSLESDLDIEEFIVDLFYWFSKSSKRKHLLLDYCQLCDHSYRSITKQVSTRWLSLELAIECSLNNFQGLLHVSNQKMKCKHI